MRGSNLAKRADRWIGIPLVAVLSLGRRKRTLPQSIQRIGVMKEAAIGDTVALAAALSDLRNAFPKAIITLFAGDTNFEFSKLLTVPDAVARLPLGNPMKAAGLISAAKLDVLLDYGQWPRINAIISSLARVRYTVGFKAAGQARHYAYDAVCEHRSDLHEVDNFRAMAAVIAPVTGPAVFGLRLEQFASGLGESYAVVHMWPGGERSELKEWPRAYWIEVIAELRRRGLVVALTGGPADREKNERLMAALNQRGGIENLAGRPLRELPSLLQHSALVVSVNTGLMHLASVLDVPTIGLHGPTSAKRWGPYGRRSIAVSSDDPKSGYLNLGFEYPAQCEAMRRLPPQKVLDAIAKLRPSNPAVSASAPSATSDSMA